MLTSNLIAKRFDFSSDDYTTEYSYDSLDRLIQVQNHKAEKFGFSYDLNDRLREITRPGSSTSFKFDDTDFLSEISHKDLTSKVINFFDYSRDALANRKQVRSNEGSTEYSYDKNNFLTQVSKNNLVEETFSYDALGNRIQDQNGASVYDNYSQQLVEDHQYIYLYDILGNLIAKDHKNSDILEQYRYSSENRLIEYTKKNNDIVVLEAHYAYGPLGRRLQKKVIDHVNTENSFTRNFLYDGNEIAQITDENANTISTYTHSGLKTDDALAIDTNGNSYFFIKDALGSIASLVDHQGSMVQSYVYSAFGIILSIKDQNGDNVTAAPPIAPYFTFTGREFDQESGLYYYRARTYDSVIGRFFQIDPDRGKLSIPLSHISKYLYVLNNPIKLIDPTGLAFIEDFLVDELNFGKDLAKYTEIAIAAAVIVAAAIASPAMFAIAVAASLAQADTETDGGDGIEALFKGEFSDRFLKNLSFNSAAVLFADYSGTSTQGFAISQAASLSSSFIITNSNLSESEELFTRILFFGFGTAGSNALTDGASTAPPAN